MMTDVAAPPKIRTRPKVYRSKSTPSVMPSDGMLDVSIDTLRVRTTTTPTTKSPRRAKSGDAGSVSPEDYYDEKKKRKGRRRLGSKPEDTDDGIFLMKRPGAGGANNNNNSKNVATNLMTKLKLADVTSDTGPEFHQDEEKEVDNSFLQRPSMEKIKGSYAKMREMLSSKTGVY